MLITKNIKMSQYIVKTKKGYLKISTYNCHIFAKNSDGSMSNYSNTANFVSDKTKAYHFTSEKFAYSAGKHFCAKLKQDNFKVIAVDSIDDKIDDFIFQFSIKFDNLKFKVWKFFHEKKEPEYNHQQIIDRINDEINLPSVNCMGEFDKNSNICYLYSDNIAYKASGYVSKETALKLPKCVIEVSIDKSYKDVRIFYKPDINFQIKSPSPFKEDKDVRQIVTYEGIEYSVMTFHKEKVVITDLNGKEHSFIKMNII